MSVLTSVLEVCFSKLRLVLFQRRNGQTFYFAEKCLPYDGFTEVGFSAPEDVFSKIQQLFDLCESEYGSIDSVANVVLPGVFYKFSVNERSISINGGIVTEKDIADLNGKSEVRLPGYEDTEIIPLYYKSFGNPMTLEPLGERTDKLFLTSSIGYLKLPIKELFDNCAKRLGRTFVYTSCCSAAAAKADNDLVKGEGRIIVILADGYIDVALCKGAAPVDVRTELYGDRQVYMYLEDCFKLDISVAKTVAIGANLNLPEETSLDYSIGESTIHANEVNGCIAEILTHYAKLVRDCIEDLTEGEAFPICLTGSDLCLTRGVREIFENQLGRKVLVLKSEVNNLEGCADYMVSSFINSDKKVTLQTKIADFITRIIKRRV